MLRFKWNVLDTPRVARATRPDTHPRVLVVVKIGVEGMNLPHKEDRMPIGCLVPKI